MTDHFFRTFFRQVSALLLKQCLLWFHRPILTCVELLVPTAFVCLLLVGWVLFPEEAHPVGIYGYEPLVNISKLTSERFCLFRDGDNKNNETFLFPTCTKPLAYLSCLSKRSNLTNVCWDPWHDPRPVVEKLQGLTSPFSLPSLDAYIALMYWGQENDALGGFNPGGRAALYKAGKLYLSGKNKFLLSKLRNYLKMRSELVERILWAEDFNSLEEARAYADKHNKKQFGVDDKEKDNPNFLKRSWAIVDISEVQLPNFPLKSSATAANLRFTISMRQQSTPSTFTVEDIYAVGLAGTEYLFYTYSGFLTLQSTINAWLSSLVVNEAMRHAEEICTIPKTFSRRLDERSVQQQQFPVRSPSGVSDLLASSSSTDTSFPSSFSSFTALLDGKGAVHTQEIASAPMPTPSYRNSPFMNQYAAIFIPIIMTLAMVLPLARIVGSIVDEKEKCIRSALIAMGLWPFHLYMSIVLTILISQFFTSLGMVIVAKLSFFSHTNFLMLFVVFYAFGLNVGGVGILASTYFEHVRSAVVGTPLVFFVTSVPHYVIPATASSVQLGFLSLLPVTAFGKAISILIEISNKRDVVWGDFLKPFSSSSFSLGLCVLLMVVDFVLYCFLAFVVDFVHFPRVNLAIYELKEWWKHFSFGKKKLNPAGSSAASVEEEGAEKAAASIGALLKRHTATINSAVNPPRKVEMEGGCESTIESLLNLNHQHEETESRRKEKGTATAMAAKDVVYVCPGSSQRAVSNMSTVVRPGQLSVLLGHNGAGKTTLIRLLTGELQPLFGSIDFAVGEVQGSSSTARRPKLGYCSQSNVIWGHLSVKNHFQIFSRIKDMSFSSTEKEQTAMLSICEKLQLQDSLNQKAVHLSGGQQRKLCLALALLGNPEFLILDEPSAGLDAVSRRQVWKLLRGIAHGMNPTSPSSAAASSLIEDEISMSSENKKVVETNLLHEPLHPLGSSSLPTGVLITTHDMEEAEVLDDGLITIMAAGQTQCRGSGQFLKQLFQVGYTLILSLMSGINNCDEGTNVEDKDDSPKKGGKNKKEEHSHSLAAAPLIISWMAELSRGECKHLATKKNEIRFSLPESLLTSEFFSLLEKDVQHKNNRTTSATRSPLSIAVSGQIQSIYLQHKTMQDVFLKSSEIADEALGLSTATSITTQSPARSSPREDEEIATMTTEQKERDDEENMKPNRDDRQEQDVEPLERRTNDVAMRSSLSSPLSFQLPTGTPFSSSIYQFFSSIDVLTRKRMQSSLRDRRTLFYQVIFPVIMITLALVILLIQFPSQPPLLLSPYGQFGEDGHYISQIVFTEPKAILTGERDGYAFAPSSAVGQVQCLEGNNCTGAIARTLLELLTGSHQNNTSYIDGNARRLFALALNTTMYLENDKDKEEKGEKEDLVGILHNVTMPHSLPTSLSAVHTSLLRQSIIDFCKTSKQKKEEAIGANYSKEITEKIKESIPLLQTVNYPLNQGAEGDEIVKAIKGVVGSFVALVPFLFIPASYCSYIVRERVSKSKHLQLMSGASKLTYWIGSFFWDYTMYLITATITCLIFLAFQVEMFVGDTQTFFATYTLFLLYGFVAILQSYVITFFVSGSHIAAQLFSLVLNLFFGLIMNIMTLLLSFDQNGGNNSSKNSVQSTNWQLRYVLRCFPAFSFGEGIILLAIRYMLAKIAQVPMCSPWAPVTSDTMQGSRGGIGTNLIYLASFIPVFVGVMIICEKGGNWWKQRVPRKLRAVVSELSSSSLLSIAQGEEKERDTCQKISSLSSPTCEVNHLWKVYPFHAERKKKKKEEKEKEKRKKEEAHDAFLTAVRDLNFQVFRGEIFALLGANGAGKSSTVSILCGEELATAGNFCIRKPQNGALNGIQDEKASTTSIGYCPQLAGLDEMLTPLEHLQLHGNLRGLSNAQIQTSTQHLFSLMKLSKLDWRKPIGALSGGSKRKVSLAIAVIAVPPFIVIDEASAGADPAARQKLMECMHYVRSTGSSQGNNDANPSIRSTTAQKSNKIKVKEEEGEGQQHHATSILMTTHHLEEVDELASRVAMMQRGSIVVHGTLNELYALYGGYGVRIFLRMKKKDVAHWSIEEEESRKVDEGGSEKRSILLTNKDTSSSSAQRGQQQNQTDQANEEESNPQHRNNVMKELIESASEKLSQFIISEIELFFHHLRQQQQLLIEGNEMERGENVNEENRNEKRRGEQFTNSSKQSNHRFFENPCVQFQGVNHSGYFVFELKKKADNNINEHGTKSSRRHSQKPEEEEGRISKEAKNEKTQKLEEKCDGFEDWRENGGSSLQPSIECVSYSAVLSCLEYLKEKEHHLHAAENGNDDEIDDVWTVERYVVDATTFEDVFMNVYAEQQEL